MIENAMGKALMGAAALGDWVNQCGFILMGKMDEELGCLSYYREFNKVPEGPEDLLLVAHIVERIKETFRQTLMMGLERDYQIEIRQLAADSRKALIAVQDGFRKMNRPADEGTVAELAVKYNVSLSHIRKLKRDNPGVKMSELFSDVRTA